MIAATLRTPPFRGIRRVDPSRDLGALADLIELSFASSMDASGRAVVRELRTLSGPAARLGLGLLGDELLKGMSRGLVWEEDGRLVGNVTPVPARLPPDCPRMVVLANVAVHPDYQRRGIARQLMETALTAARKQGMQSAILQVEQGNEGAHRLYERLGFRTERTWHNWRRGGQSAPPYRSLNAPRITLRPGNRWQEEYATAEQVFPAERGGLGWQRPLHKREFTRPPLRMILDFLSGTSLERWIVRDGDRIAGSLWAQMGFGGGATQLTLLVHPDWHGRLEDPLISYALRRLDYTRRAVTCEHPADDLVATAVFERYGFFARRTLHHMRLDF